MARRPLRVLYCETNVDGTIGGSYFSLLYLVRGLDRSRYAPIALFYREHGLLQAFRDAGAEVIVWPRREPYSFADHLPPALRMARAPVVAFQKALNLAAGLLGASRARARFLRVQRIDIVHLNNSIRYNHDWMLAALLTRRVCVCHERGINDSYPWLARRLAPRLDAIISISQAVTANMRARGVAFTNLSTVHNGLDPSVMVVHTPRDELRATYGIDTDAPVVVMLGNLKHWKGQHTVVQAIDAVRRKHPSIRCVFVGATSPADRDYERQLHAQVEALQLHRHIVFAGYQSHPADFVMMSDIVVHASVDPEPFGRVILEAMACRKPVVGARGGAITELVVDNETGLTFTPGDGAGLAEAIAALVADPVTAVRFGENGYNRLVREFHIDRNVAAIQALYDRATQGTTTGTA